MDLAVIEEIKQLKYRYLRTLDTKDWDGFEGCFVPEATGDYGEGLAFADRSALVGYMRENLGPTVVTMHHCHHPEIALDGDTLEVNLTLTTPGCPMSGTITNATEQILLKRFPNLDVKVNLVWSPPWSTEMITEEGMRQLEAKN